MSTPEEASEYLSRTNFKSIIEWLTAEAILNRPDDPMTFCKNLLNVKIDNRGGIPYTPEQPTEYVRACYAEASNLADEHGMIHGKVVAPVSTSSNEKIGQIEKRLATMERLIEASRSIADSLDPYDATNTIIKEACSILGADRASIFTVSNDKSHLILMVAEGAKNIEVPIGVGIAGGVAATGESVNIPDCYNDSRFDPSFDKKTGYKTNNIFCAPIGDSTGEIVGVLQILNKADGPFGAEDEEICRILTAQAGIALKNAKSYKQQMLVQQKLRSVTDLVRAMQADMGVNSLIFTMTAKAPSLVDADRCTIFLIDEKAGAIWSQQGEINLRIDLEKPAIACTVAKTGQGINIPDAYADERFNQDVDKKSGYKTNSILCLPIKAKAKTVGVIQLINKSEGFFDEDDEEMMDTFLALVGPILLESSLVASTQTGTGNEATGISKTMGSKAPTLSDFAEGDEEDEED